MKVFYYKSPHPNFGDDINSWIWGRLIPHRLNERDGITMLGIGTVIGQKLPYSEKKIVFSSGAGYGIDLPKPSDSSWRFLAVRGPLTAELLGLSPEAAVTDGAILVSLFSEFSVSPDRRRGVVFMPHISAARAAHWQPICAAAGIEYLDPRDDQLVLLKRIASAQLVLADAMHAAIVADSLRVPWIPLISSAEISTFKWLDWTLSLDMKYEPKRLKPMTLLQIIKNFLIFLTLERHSIEEADSDAVLAAQRDYLQRKEKIMSGASRHVRRLAGGVYNRISRWSLMSKPLFNVDANVAVLSDLRVKPGFMSRDEIFVARRRELQNRLKELA